MCRYLFTSILILDTYVRGSVPCPCVGKRVTTFRMRKRAKRTRVGGGGHAVMISMNSRISVRRLHVAGFIMGSRTAFGARRRCYIDPTGFPSAKFSSLTSLPTKTSAHISFAGAIPFLLHACRSCR